MTDLDNWGVWLRTRYAQPMYVLASNAANPLTTPTYDGSGEATHPSVVRVPGGIGGYEYWMAMTPYPAADVTKENPSILRSTDGLTWEVPTGLTNPIAPAPGGSGYNADTELVYSGGTLYCVYSEWDGATYQTIRLKTSTDGVNWSAASQLWQTVEATEGSNSPAIVWDGSQWVCYTVDLATTPYTVRRRTAASISGPWSASSACTYDYDTGLTIWHIGAAVANGVTYLVAMGCNQGSHGAAPTWMQLWRSSNGVDFVKDRCPFLKPESSGWTSGGLYRPTFLLEGDTLRLWYGAYSSANAWRIGYTECKLVRP